MLPVLCLDSTRATGESSLGCCAASGASPLPPILSAPAGRLTTFAPGILRNSRFSARRMDNPRLLCLLCGLKTRPGRRVVSFILLQILCQGTLYLADAPPPCPVTTFLHQGLHSPFQLQVSKDHSTDISALRSNQL